MAEHLEHALGTSCATMSEQQIGQSTNLVLFQLLCILHMMVALGYLLPCLKSLIKQESSDQRHDCIDARYQPSKHACMAEHLDRACETSCDKTSRTADQPEQPLCVAPCKIMKPAQSGCSGQSVVMSQQSDQAEVS